LPKIVCASSCVSPVSTGRPVDSSVGIETEDGLPRRAASSVSSFCFFCVAVSFLLLVRAGVGEVPGVPPRLDFFTVEPPCGALSLLRLLVEEEDGAPEGVPRGMVNGRFLKAADRFVI
jgi:hypothetical protein